jgi:hypothetical protein
MSDETEQEHGIRTAWYANTPCGYVAVMECLCGEECSGQTDSWESTGAALDEHLKPFKK